MAKLAANAVNLLAGLVILGLVPRSLGPESYGRYEFLSNFFHQVRGFLDMGTSTCFYTRLSQRRGDAGLVAFYHRLLLAGSVLMIGGAWLLAGTSLGDRLWAGEEIVPVLLAAGFGALMWWLDTKRKMVDAWHLTVQGEMLYAASRVATVLILAVVVWWWGLQVEGYFIFQIATTLLVILALSHLLKRRGPRVEEAGDAQQPSRAYFRDFWAYSHPLVAYASVGVLVGVADRWVLQTWAGAVEQGFFGLAYQVGAVCFLFTNAMTPLLTREFAVAWGQQDLERMRDMFRRVIPMLYAVAAYFSVFVACHAADVAWLFGGQAWEQGALAMAIMALYPMHQTYGQLSGSVYFATGKTRLYRNIGIADMLAGIPVMLWLVLPAESGGLGLGAVGLALKMVAMQFIAVNVGLWFNVRLLSLGYWKFFAHQLGVPMIFLVCAFISSVVISPLEITRLARFVFEGAVYTILAAGMILSLPKVVGMRRSEIVLKLRKALGGTG